MIISKRYLTEVRLKNALERIIAGTAKNVKITGKLTLNKINTEAGLGNSYIHKFPEFIAYATPIINRFNESKSEFSNNLNFSTSSEIQELRKAKAREQRLKIKYRDERDDAKQALKLLEVEVNLLMFRLYELQEELVHYRVKPIN